MCKHVDLLAVALLLCGIALYSHAKAVAHFSIIAPVRIVLPSQYGGRVIVVPRMTAPPAPTVPFYRD
jgi:hypothetical protein